MFLHAGHIYNVILPVLCDSVDVLHIMPLHVYVECVCVYTETGHIAVVTLSIHEGKKSRPLPLRTFAILLFGCNKCTSIYGNVLIGNISSVVALPPCVYQWLHHMSTVEPFYRGHQWAPAGCPV